MAVDPVTGKIIGTDTQVVNPLQLERDAYTQSLYAGSANRTDFGYAPSSFSSTDGAKTVADVTTAITPPPAPTDPKTGQPIAPPPVNPVDTLTAQTIQKEMDAGKTQAEKDADSATALWTSLVPYDDAQGQKNRRIESIKNTYAAARKLLEESNARTEKTIETAGIRSGTARYAPEIQAGIMASEERASAVRIGELNAKEQSAINDIEQAFSDKEYTKGVQKYQMLQGIQDTKNKAIKDAQEKASENLKKLQERERIINIDTAVSDLMGTGIANPNTIAQKLKEKGITATAKEIGDAFTNLIPPKVALADISADERIFNQLLANGTLPKGSTIFDYWKKKDEATRDPKSTDPLLSLIRELTVQSKIDEMNGFIKFVPKDQKEFDYADGFRMAVSDATIGQQKQRGITFSKFMENGQYDKARDYIFKTALETSGVDDQRQIGGAANTLRLNNGGFTMNVSGITSQPASSTLLQFNGGNSVIADKLDWQLLCEEVLSTAFATSTCSWSGSASLLDITFDSPGVSSASYPQCTFNTDYPGNGTNYGYRNFEAFAIFGAPSTATSNMRMFNTATTSPLFFSLRMNNNSSRVKNGEYRGYDAQLAGTIYTGRMSWNNTSAQITQVNCRTDNVANTWNAGTALRVYGIRR